MAEIKSTLDLVMERTKHLTLSAEEKAGQHKKAFEKKLQGLLQQYVDTILSIDGVLAKVSALQKELQIDDQTLVVSAVVQRIQPGLDNEQWLSLVGRLAPAAYTPLKEALAEYRDKAAVLSRKGGQRLLERLVRKHGIQGSAVVPNLRKYGPHQEELSSLKKIIQTRIDKTKNATNG